MGSKVKSELVSMYVLMVMSSKRDHNDQLVAEHLKRGDTSALRMNELAVSVQYEVHIQRVVLLK